MKIVPRRWPKSFLIGCAAVVLSTLGIQASDMLDGVTGRLSGLVYDAAGPCGMNAVLWRYADRTVCVDIYEASPAASCPQRDVINAVYSAENVAAGACRVATVSGALPWRFVSYTQAQQMCARSGKRLPRAEEWYQFTLGQTNIDTCVLATNGVPYVTGSAPACVTPFGVYDAIGNVWEWMSDTVTNGEYANRVLPESGYVALVDGAGVVIETSDTPQLAFGKDYAWVNHEGVRGMLRGGFYQSREDGGLFAQNLSVGLDFSAAGVGFRCVRDL